jgi:hypothetical protein
LDDSLNAALASGSKRQRGGKSTQTGRKKQRGGKTTNQVVSARLHYLMLYN